MSIKKTKNIYINFPNFKQKIKNIDEFSRFGIKMDDLIFLFKKMIIICDSCYFLIKKN